MKIRYVSGIIFWVDPITKNLITPEEYVKLSKERQMELIPHFEKNYNTELFAFCPTCGKWERYNRYWYLFPKMVNLAYDCRELEIMENLEKHDYKFMSNYLECPEEYTKEKILEHIKKRTEYYVKKIREYNFSVNMMCSMFEVLLAYYNYFKFEEINNILEKAMIKIIKYRLKT